MTRLRASDISTCSTKESDKAQVTLTIGKQGPETPEKQTAQLHDGWFGLI